MNKYILTLAIITLIGTLAWVITDINHKKVEDLPISSKLQEAIEPLDPQFDQATLNKIKDTVITGTDQPINPTLLATPTQTPRATSSARPLTTPRPSQTPKPSSPSIR